MGNCSPDDGDGGPEVARGDSEALGEAPATPEQISGLGMRRERAREPGPHRSKRGTLPRQRGVADQDNDLGARGEEPTHPGCRASMPDLEHALRAPVDDVRHHAIGAHETLPNTRTVGRVTEIAE
jgi:hypothetical protein